MVVTMKLGMDGFYRHFPVVGGVDCHFCSVPDWIFCSALSKLFLQRVQMEEVYMASLILLIVFIFEDALDAIS